MGLLDQMARRVFQHFVHQTPPGDVAQPADGVIDFGGRG